MELIGLLILISLLLISVWARVSNKKRRYRFDGANFPIEPSSSLLSAAIVELLAVAGGIYLSLVMVAAFLQLDLSQKVIVGGVPLDPIALVSLLLALMHPFATRVWCFVKGD